ncbi:WxL domain-containing protein [Carnobacterium maltaromaticum]|uniref:WxL domain-containing protein n=1 Tax=Carnobacterium maltaromaticum TaxID=2751 RepID=A0AAW9JZD4_CARML|nr:WxL domain-containing protein [Carnobacterium maltaromaticum]MDZ5759994.1 WxL domain-containing protein [Carnobacterium maltaromaticum]
MKLTRSTILSLAVLAGVTLNSTAVFAAEVGKEVSPTQITIEKGDETGGGTDPIIPIDPIDPPNTGELRIDAVSSFNFGKIKLSTATSKDAEFPEGKSLGVQVTDIRGSGLGWKLTAKIDELKGQTNPSNILKAKISIPAGKVSTLTIDETSMLFPATSSAVTLSGEEVTVMGAADKHGLGTWADDFTADGKNVSINIPTNAYIDTYKGNITWSLQNVPN